MSRKDLIEKLQDAKTRKRAAHTYSVAWYSAVHDVEYFTRLLKKFH